MTRSAFAMVLCGALLAGSLSACGSDTKAASKTVVSTVVRTATPVATATPTDTVTTDASEEPTEAVPSVSGVLAPNRPDTPLTADEFFASDGWEQQVVDVADKSGVQGIVSSLECGSRTLELRLNNAFASLSFDVGQDNASTSSSVTITMTVAVNGRQVQAKKIAFNKIQHFDVNVAGANAVILTAQSEDCDETSPVVFNAYVK